MDGNFWAPPEVETLNLRWADLYRIPSSFKALKALKRLDVHKNRIFTLPRWKNLPWKELYVETAILKQNTSSLKQNFDKQRHQKDA